MKFFTAAFFAVFLLTLRAAVAQDASTVPIPDAQSTTPPAPQPLASPTPFSLMPDNMPPPVEKPSRHGSSDRNTEPTTREGATPGLPGPVVKKNKTEANTDDIGDRIKFREAKARALKDEKVQQLDALAAAAKTDPEKRAALREYYTVLYAKILKIDGSIKKLVSQRLKDSLNTLDQGKVRPKGYLETLVSH